MLHSKAYNDGITAEMKEAYRFKDRSALDSLIKISCEELIMLDTTDPRYDIVASQLHIALALLNSICKRGETVALINDVVNF